MAADRSRASPQRQPSLRTPEVCFRGGALRSSGVGGGVWVGGAVRHTRRPPPARHRRSEPSYLNHHRYSLAYLLCTPTDADQRLRLANYNEPFRRRQHRLTSHLMTTAVA